MISQLCLSNMPSFIYFQVDDKISTKWIPIISVENVKYRLCGMIYFGGFHFTARIISEKGDISFQDSMSSETSKHYEGNIEDSKSVRSNKDPKERTLSIVIYVVA